MSGYEDDTGPEDRPDEDVPQSEESEPTESSEDDLAGRDGGLGRPAGFAQSLLPNMDDAAELADTARQRIVDAGTEHDPKARDRLLASTNHTLTSEILGIFLPPEVHQQRAAELAETLDEIDQRPESNR